MDVERLEKLLDSFERYFLFVALFVMLVLTFAEVLSRYVFHFSIAFAEEITVNLFAWSVMIGAAVTAKKNGHVGFSLITDNLPLSLRRWVLLLVGFICSFVMLMFLYYGVEMVASQMLNGQRTPALEMPEWIMGLSIPVGAALCAIHFAQTGMKNWLKRGREAEQRD